MQELLAWLEERISLEKNDSGQVRIPGVNCSFAFGEVFFAPLPEKRESPLTFVDGGCAEILLAPHFGVFFTRIVSLSYSGGKKTVAVSEFFTALAENHDSFALHCIQHAGELLIKEETILKKDLPPDLCTLSAAGQFLRRLAEIRMAKKHSSSVLDGTLYAPSDLEQEELKNAESITSVAKTCTWLTDDGNSWVQVLGSRAPLDAWIYVLGDVREKSYSAQIAFVKFHPLSRYVFKVEAAQKVDQCLPALLSHTSDASFLGYPYGLVLADRLARISVEEQRRLRLKLRALLSRRWSGIECSLHSLDAHTVLDAM